MYYTKKMIEEEKHTYISYIEEANVELDAELTEEEKAKIIEYILNNELYRNTRHGKKWEYETVKFHIRHNFIYKLK